MSEKDDLRGLPAAIGMVVLALLFGGVILAIYPGWVPVGKFLVENLKLPEQAPAWVQAVGSIGVLAYSWHVFNLSRQNEIKDREIASLSAERAQIRSAITTLLDLKIAMQYLGEKLEAKDLRGALATRERFDSIELTLRSLQNKTEGYRTHDPILVALREISYTKVALSEINATRQISNDRLVSHRRRINSIEDKVLGLQLVFNVENTRLAKLMYGEIDL